LVKRQKGDRAPHEIITRIETRKEKKKKKEVLSEQGKKRMSETRGDENSVFCRG
jgi:hypothetical protein